MNYEVITYSTLTSSVRVSFVGSLLLLGSACSLQDNPSSGNIHTNTAHSASAGDNPCTTSLRAGYIEHSDYRIGAGDELTISVRHHNDLSVARPVRSDGTILMELDGKEIHVGNRTIKEVEAAITQMLEEHIPDPIVNVVISNVQYEGARTRVTGAVQNAMSIPYCKGMTVLDLVREAGGVTDTANLSAAALFRSDGSRLRIRLDHILEGSDMAINYTLRHGDTVTVPSN